MGRFPLRLATSALCKSGGGLACPAAPHPPHTGCQPRGLGRCPHGLHFLLCKMEIRVCLPNKAVLTTNERRTWRRAWDSIHAQRLLTDVTIVSPTLSPPAGSQKGFVCLVWWRSSDFGMLLYYYCLIFSCMQFFKSALSFMILVSHSTKLRNSVQILTLNIY